MKPLVFTREGKRIATLTPQEGKAGEVFTLGSAAKCDIVVSAEFGLAPQQVSFSPLGGVWWIGDIAARRAQEPSRDCVRHTLRPCALAAVAHLRRLRFRGRA